MTIGNSVFILTGAIATLMMASVSCTSSRDLYLRTLHLDVEYLDPVDSVNVEDYDIFQPNNALAVDDEWILMSSTKGDYNLMFLNTVTSDYFFVIRRGRGPGEMVSGNNLYRFSDNYAAYYDYNSGICVNINLKETIDSHRAVLDTIGVFRDKSPKPVYIGSCGRDGFIAGNTVDETVWYSFFDPKGNVLSSVPAFGYKDLPDSRDYILSWHLSSKYVSNPSGTKVCVTNVASPTISFSNVESGILTEYRRYEIAPPQRGSDARNAFHGLCADDTYVYLLYSGYMFSGDVLPGYTCNHLIVYDWDGNPVKHYYLSCNINSVQVEGNCITGTSDYPECKVYKYLLDGLK